MIDIFQGSGAPLTDAGVTTALRDLGGDAASLWALVAVETRGFGYFADRRPQILFERHIFHGRTDGEFSASNPDISNPNSGGYIGGAAEYDRLKRAMVLDRQAALESASWGLGQIMGFNAEKLGYSDVDEMIAAFRNSEDGQLEGAVRYITGSDALLRAYRAQNWARVAFFYNGKNFAARGYDKKLQAAHQRFSTGAPPDIAVRAAQARLTYLGFNPKGVDGVNGQGTAAALRLFQSRNGLPVSGNLDPATSGKLREAAGV